MTTAPDRRLTARIEAVIAARNAAYDAQQRYADTTAGVGAESLGKAGQSARQNAADDLCDATNELVNRIDALVTSTEWQNLTLGLNA